MGWIAVSRPSYSGCVGNSHLLRNGCGGSLFLGPRIRAVLETSTAPSQVSTGPCSWFLGPRIRAVLETSHPPPRSRHVKRFLGPRIRAVLETHPAPPQPPWRHPMVSRPSYSGCVGNRLRSHLLRVHLRVSRPSYSGCVGNTCRLSMK